MSVAETPQSLPRRHEPNYRNTLVGTAHHNLRFCFGNITSEFAPRRGDRAAESGANGFRLASRTSRSAPASRRKAGIQKAVDCDADGWAGSAAHHTGRCFASPGVLRRVRGRRAECSARIATLPCRSQRRCRRAFAFSRRISPELCFIAPPSKSKRAQGRPGAGWHPRSAARKARAKKTAQQHTGVADHSAFPAQWLDGLCRDLPGADHSFWPPSPREFG